MQRRLTSLSLSAAMLVALACAGTDDGATPPSAGEAAHDRSPEGDDGDRALGESVGTELPVELVAELRLQGDDADGRLLTLAPGFVATAPCSDCGAPSYLWFLAVRCADDRHCEVLTAECEGRISREANTYVLEFRPVEAGTEPEVCGGYSGTFERP
jgi:hypothetical protein